MGCVLGFAPSGAPSGKTPITAPWIAPLEVMSELFKTVLLRPIAMEPCFFTLICDHLPNGRTAPLAVHERIGLFDGNKEGYMLVTGNNLRDVVAKLIADIAMV